MKKQQITLTLFLLIGGFTFGQTTVAKAFSVSYQNEYNKNYVNAISVIDKIYDAKSYEINLRLGWLTYLNGDYLKSQTYYKNAMALNPLAIEAKLGYAYPTGALLNWEDVIKTYSSILLIDTKNYKANFNMATIYYNKKNFEKAKNYATTINKLYPFDFSTNLLLGKINISLGNLTIAKQYLNKALLYNPTADEVKGLLKKI